MGVQGTLEYFSNLLSSVKKKKKKQTQTVALKIRMDCEGCARKVKHVLAGVKGAKSVDIDMKQQKATVTGYVEPKKVLKAAQSTKKKVELWPYVPYTMVAHPYISQAYDKKAPPNMVRKVADTSNVKETTVDDHYLQMFSDENPNACSIIYDYDAWVDPYMSHNLNDYWEGNRRFYKWNNLVGPRCGL